MGVPTSGRPSLLSEPRLIARLRSDRLVRESHDGLLCWLAPEVVDDDVNLGGCLASAFAVASESSVSRTTASAPTDLSALTE